MFTLWWHLHILPAILDVFINLVDFNCISSKHEEEQRWHSYRATLSHCPIEVSQTIISCKLKFLNYKWGWHLSTVIVRIATLFGTWWVFVNVTVIIYLILRWSVKHDNILKCSRDAWLTQIVEGRTLYLGLWVPAHIGCRDYLKK